jgi:hypothetical protein
MASLTGSSLGELRRPGPLPAAGAGGVWKAGTAQYSLARKRNSSRGTWYATSSGPTHGHAPAEPEKDLGCVLQIVLFCFYLLAGRWVQNREG